MPTTVFQDDFDVAADTSLESHTPDVGTSWAEAEDTQGALSIVARSLTDDCRPGANSSSNRVIYTCTPNPTLGGPDYDVSFKITSLATADDPMFMVARWADASNYYSAGVRSGAATDMVIAKKVAGVVTELASGSFTPAVNDVIKFELRGSTLKLYQNATERLSVTDSAIASTGAAGIGFGNAWVSTEDVNVLNRLDDFTVVDQNVAAGGGRLYQQQQAVNRAASY
jgi:hypothetical protein